MARNIINSKGTSVGKIVGSAIFDLQGHKLYTLRGINIYKRSGELVGRLCRCPQRRCEAKSIGKQTISPRLKLINRGS